MSVRFEMRVDDALMARIDSARGDESRAAWIKRTLAVALSGRVETRSSEASAHVDPPSSASAPRRAPVKRAAPARDVQDEGTPLPKIARRHWA